MVVVRSVRSRRFVNRRRGTTEKATVMLMRDRAMSTAGDVDYASERITIAAVMMSGLDQGDGGRGQQDGDRVDNMPEELVLYAWPSAWPVRSPAR